MTQNNLLDSTKEALYQLIRGVIYKPADTFRKNPNYLQDVGKLTLEQRMVHVNDYLRKRDNQNWKYDIETLLSHVDGADINDVADAGSGPGLSAECIIDRFNPNRLVLVDAIPEMLAVAKQRLESRQEQYNGKIEYINGQVEELPALVKEPVDLVVMHWVIPYTKWQKQKQMLKGIREKALREGGMLLFNIPYEDPEFPDIDFYIAQAFAQHLHLEYDIPQLDKLSGVTMPTSSLTDYVDNSLSKARFKRVSKKPEVIYLNNQQIGEYVAGFASVFSNNLGMLQLNGRVPQTDYERIKGEIPNMASTIYKVLSGRKMYKQSHVIYVATK